jgi:hypothetical protein
VLKKSYNELIIECCGAICNIVPNGGAVEISTSYKYLVSRPMRRGLGAAAAAVHGRSSAALAPVPG